MIKVVSYLKQLQNIDQIINLISIFYEKNVAQHQKYH